MSRRAVIDIGTNSTLLLIGSLNAEQHIEAEHQEFLVTRLGEGVHEDRIIRPQAMQRTLKVLELYRAKIHEMNATGVDVIGTQALRYAQNSAEFAALVRDQLGWDIKIISGEEEAQCSFAGALDAITDLNGKLTVMDVGGGSTEVINGLADGEIKHFESLPIGVVRLGEELGMKPALLPEDVDSALNTARGMFSSLPFFDALPSSERFIGVGGTVTTLVAIREKMRTYEPQKINGATLKYAEIRQLFSMLNSLPMAERRKLPGLVPGREDVILYGTLIFLALMQETGFEEVIASDRGLRFGYLKKQLSQ